MLIGGKKLCVPSGSFYSIVCSYSFDKFIAGVAGTLELSSSLFSPSMKLLRRLFTDASSSSFGSMGSVGSSCCCSLTTSSSSGECEFEAYCWANWSLMGIYSSSSIRSLLSAYWSTAGSESKEGITISVTTRGLTVTFDFLLFSFFFYAFFLL